MTDLSATRTFWKQATEFLHRLTVTLTSRDHYPAGHPAIAQADQASIELLPQLLEHAPQLDIGVVENCFVIGSHPLPGLSDRISTLRDAMRLHGMRGIAFGPRADVQDLTHLATALRAPAPNPKERSAFRSQLQSLLRDVQIGFVHLGGDTGAVVAKDVEAAVRELLLETGRAIRAQHGIDQVAIREMADQLVSAVEAQSYRLRFRRHERGWGDLAGHTTNVALMSAAMGLGAALPRNQVVDICAAALAHDLGYFLLPPQLQAIPAPLHNAKQRKIAQMHPWLGAKSLLEQGCPGIWIAVALEHHRGIDGLGFPALSTRARPHHASQIVALANYIDRKRTALSNALDEPEVTIRGANALGGRYFDPTWLKVYLRAIGLFAPGTHVSLSTGEKAITANGSQRNPLRPQATLVDGPDAGETIDLTAFDIVERCYERSIVSVHLPEARPPSERTPDPNPRSGGE